MKYTITAVQQGEIITEQDTTSIQRAIKLATKMAANTNYAVYVTWYRANDGQHGYLTQDGNHDMGAERYIHPDNID